MDYRCTEEFRRAGCRPATALRLRETARSVKRIGCIGLLAALCCVTKVGAESEHPVEARLLADASAVLPGEALRLGVALRMQEGWHTYWAFSGDAGMPTQVEWDLPEGWRAGPLQWPLPKKYTEEGDLVVYGYGDEVLLISDVQAPQSAVQGDTLRVAADVSWLVCRELCIPGDARVEIDLPIGRGQAKHSAIFERYAAEVPPVLSPSIDVRYGVRGRGMERRVELSVQSAEPLRPDYLDFYPLDAEDVAFRSRSLGEGRLELVIEPYGDAPILELGGVLVYALEGEGRRSGRLALDLSQFVEDAEGGLLDRRFRTSSAGDKTSLWVYLLMALGGGFLLNLMPCVLPVISLKVLSIVGQAGQRQQRVRLLGLAFAFGIVASFMALALVVIGLKGGGEQIGWGFQFQYPGFVAAMAALIFALGLSLFGVYSISLPVSAGGFDEGEGPAASFFNGVLATVLATPCTAPLLGTAVGFAFAQPAGTTLTIFLGCGVGMALPYAVLAAVPSWTRFLPRPGAWMERFKQAMGFPLMATVLWLLWVLGKQVGAEGVVWTGAFLLGIALACWVVGQWVRLEDRARRRRAVWAIALAIVLVAYGAFLHPLLKRVDATRALPETSSSIDWIDFSPAEVERRVGSGQTVFIDFTAEWCWTCKVNERAVLMQDDVQARFKADDVAMIKADWTRRNPEITQLLSAFGRSGVPLYVLFPGGNLDEPILLPELITKEIVADALVRAKAQRKAP